MERSLSMELVRVTELAALSSARWVGRGMKNEADHAATEAMRKMFDTFYRPAAVPSETRKAVGEASGGFRFLLRGRGLQGGSFPGRR